MNLIKEYKIELFSLLLQAMVYYAYPIWLNPDVPLDLMLYSAIVLCIISFFNALFSKSRLRFWYPFAALPLFVPSAVLFMPGKLLLFLSTYLAAGYIGSALVALPYRLRTLITKKIKK